MPNRSESDPTDAVEVTHHAPGKTSPHGIGGMLIVVAIGLCLSGLQNLTYFLGSLLPIIRESIWERLTFPTSEAFHPQWKGFLIYQVIISSFTFVANILILILFFRKNRIFPTLIVAIIPLTFVTALVAHCWSGLIPVVSNSPDYSKEAHGLVVKFFALHIWVPYFLVSKRVQGTFVS